MEYRLDTAKGRFDTYMHMLFVDHGILRILYYTKYALSEKMARTNQPLPFQLRREAANGIRTVVNLRGENKYGSYFLEEEACRKHGLEMVNFTVKSRDVPSKEVLHGARDLFDKIEYPAIMHCKSGADRVGFMSTLYLYFHENRPLEEALKQLNWTYGHVSQGKTGILDYFFERYIEHNKQTPTDFFDWVDNVYDPEEVKESFTSTWWANMLVDRILRRE